MFSHSLYVDYCSGVGGVLVMYLLVTVVSGGTLSSTMYAYEQLECEPGLDQYITSYINAMAQSTPK
jgi:hypothetical protein